MDKSAIEVGGLREVRRRKTERRINRHALRLTVERGFDGFTVEELAEVVGVSRRTFFNYFPSKEDALLGNPHDGLSPAARAVFLAGGPEGSLFPDLVELVASANDGGDVDLADVELFHQVLEREQRLVPMFMKRFAARARDIAELAAEREGTTPQDPRIKLAVELMGALLGRSFKQLVEDDTPAPLSDVLRTNLAAARALLT
ncbi:TetR family transcriptional regulator [Nakamurella sp. A5-74]|uniref:TetR family transcriptional regulator n=1 Tax=Nakamurella sp. A5-74 TaxID=3158264 RepID=A0AAU8DPF0_9ACTN